MIDVNDKSVKVCIQMLSNIISQFKNQGYLSGTRHAHAATIANSESTLPRFLSSLLAHIFLAVFYGTGQGWHLFKLVRSSISSALHLSLSLSFSLWVN